MNRWLMPFLVIGLVSTIALLTLSPLALSIKATADTTAVATKTITIAAEPHSLPPKTPLPPVAPTNLENRPVARGTVAQPIPVPLAQLLTPLACYSWPPVAVGPQPLNQATGAVRPSQPASAFAEALANLINQQRQSHGLAPLTLIPTLTQAAYRHSLDMAIQPIPAHQGSDGSSGGGRLSAAGYQWQDWAEVIGWGFTDPGSMVEWWLNDAEHRAVLLSPAFTEFGIGYATVSNTLWKNYWTVNFGRPMNTAISSAPEGSPTTTLSQAAPPIPLPAVGSAPLPTQSAVPSTTPAVSCPTTSTQSYTLIPMADVDQSHPAPVHGDLNLAQRGYTPISAQRQLIDLAGPVDADAPQLVQIFGNGQAVHFTGLYQVSDWNWQCGEHGCRGEPLAAPEATLLGVAAQPGVQLHAPDRQASIYHDGQGNDYVAVVLYAEASRLTLAYTRDGSVANGYVVHVEGGCVDPNLVQGYVEADANGRQQLPALQHRQPWGTATTEIRLAIRDRGTFLDPRSRKDWWRGF